MAYFWLETDEDVNKWKSKKKGSLSIGNQYFFNNANIILGQDPEFADELISNITSEVDILPTVRRKSEGKSKGSKYYKGINIDNFNKSLRVNLNSNPNLLFEVYNEDGIFYTSNSKKGFDFANIDTTFNLVNLWNLCFGRRALHDGQSHWNKSLENNDFIKIASEYEEFDLKFFEKGTDLKIIKNSLTILGELQFGNWGLAYRDLFKLLHADANSGVDLFVYVTAHNDLLSYASDNVVSYEKTIKILNEFSNLIKVPIWVIGLDITI